MRTGSGVCIAEEAAAQPRSVPAHLAQFGEAQRIIVLDAVRTDFESQRGGSCETAGALNGAINGAACGSPMPCMQPCWSISTLVSCPYGPPTGTAAAWAVDHGKQFERASELPSLEVAVEVKNAASVTLHACEYPARAQFSPEEHHVRMRRPTADR